MTDLVVGGGAVGTLLAWALARGGRDVAIVRRGLDRPAGPGEVAIVGLDGVRTAAPVTEVRAPADLSEPPEMILFAVKMFDLSEAVASCAAWPEATSLTSANGVGAEEIVSHDRPDAGLIAGSLTVSVDRLPDGSVARLNRGGIGLAPARGDVAGLADALVATFEAGGIRARRIGDARAMKWSKLVANLVGNASSAILDLPPGAVYADRAGFGVERRQLQEALAVMSRLGLKPLALPGADVRLLAAAIRLPPEWGRVVLRRVVSAGRGGKDPSLRIHAQRGSGPSEVAWLNGAIARAAETLGGEARVNRRLADLVEVILADPDQRAWFRERPDRLATAVGED